MVTVLENSSKCAILFHIAHICIQTLLKYIRPREPSSYICTETMILPCKSGLTICRLSKCKGEGVQKILGSCKWQMPTTMLFWQLKPLYMHVMHRCLWKCTIVLGKRWSSRRAQKQQEARKTSVTTRMCRQWRHLQLALTEPWLLLAYD